MKQKAIILSGRDYEDMARLLTGLTAVAEVVSDTKHANQVKEMLAKVLGVIDSHKNAANVMSQLSNDLMQPSDLVAIVTMLDVYWAILKETIEDEDADSNFRQFALHEAMEAKTMIWKIGDQMGLPIKNLYVSGGDGELFKEEK